MIQPTRLKLVFLDLDGTLKQERDPYVYLHRCLGTLEAAKPFTERGLRGELSYEEWTRLDASLWVGVPEKRIAEAFRRDPYLPGAREFVQVLHSAGVQVALISSGFDIHVRQVSQELGIAYTVANELCFHGGRATGEVRFGIMDGHKGPVADKLLAQTGAASHECLAMGDTNSDIELFERAAVSVAVAPTSERVRAAASIVLEEPDLRNLIARLRAFSPGFLPG